MRLMGDSSEGAQTGFRGGVIPRSGYYEGRVAIAFFDLDLTLLSLNSGAIWIRREARASRMSPWRMLRVAYYLVQYQLGRTGLAGAIREAIATLKGTHAHEFRERAAAFYELHLR